MTALQRGLALLEYLATKKEPASFTEINAALGHINRASLSALLKELRAGEYIEKDVSNGWYSCGPRMALLLNMKTKNRSEFLIARYKDIMKSIAKEYDVTALLFERVKDSLTSIYKEKTESSIGMQDLGCTARANPDTPWGQTMFSNIPGLAQKGTLSPTQQKRIKAASEKGYGDDLGSYNSKLRRLGFPLFDRQKELIGCLGVGGTILSLHDKNVPQTAQYINTRLETL